MGSRIILSAVDLAMGQSSPFCSSFAFAKTLLQTTTMLGYPNALINHEFRKEMATNLLHYHRSNHIQRIPTPRDNQPRTRHRSHSRSPLRPRRRRAYTHLLILTGFSQPAHDGYLLPREHADQLILCESGVIALWEVACEWGRSCWQCVRVRC